MQFPIRPCSPPSRIRASARSDTRFRGTALALLCGVTAGCATTPNAPNVRDMQRLADVSAVAGQPVSSFRFFNLSSYEPIGDSDLLVFTNPRDAWLLHLDGHCRDLDFGPFLGLTSTFNRVSARFDKVIVRGNPIGCQIREIRPVDTAVLKRVEKERKLDMQSSAPPSG